jgi:hypothetical protein
LCSVVFLPSSLLQRLFLFRVFSGIAAYLSDCVAPIWNLRSANNTNQFPPVHIAHSLDRQLRCRLRHLAELPRVRHRSSYQMTHLAMTHHRRSTSNCNDVINRHHHRLHRCGVHSHEERRRYKRRLCYQAKSSCWDSYDQRSGPVGISTIRFSSGFVIVG